MSRTNIFFCLCGTQIARPKDEAGNFPPVWHAKLGQGSLKGIRCNQCRSWWKYLPSRDGEYVEVVQCCNDWQCKCDWTWYATQQELEAHGEACACGFHPCVHSEEEE